MLEFMYTNHKGSTRLRTVDPYHICWMEDPVIAHLTGWFLVGFDLEKNQDRAFFLERIKWLDEAQIYQLEFKAPQ